MKIRYTVKLSFPMWLSVLLLMTACQETTEPEESALMAGRTFTLTASMPEETTPSTRLTASQETGSKDIELRWEQDDKIQLYFKAEGEIIKGEEVQVKNISIDGQNAAFDVVVPSEITGNFDLYGVHDAKSEISDGTIVADARPSSLTELGDIPIPIYFKKEGLSSGSTSSGVSFKHYGALQVLTFKNNANKKITLDSQKFNFSGSKWYYDAEDSKLPVYDIISGSVSLKAMSFSSADPVPPVELSQSDNLKLAQWIVPNETTPSAFNLDLNIDGAAKTTAAPKAVRAEALVAGRAYHLYVVWHGTYLNFTYEEAVQAYKITMTTTDPIGSTIYLRDYSTDAWIDLNGNGEKDEGELMSGHYERQEFTIRAQTLTIYGKVTDLTCSYSNLTALDVTKNTELRKLSCYNNLLTALDVTKSTALETLLCYSNAISGESMSILVNSLCNHSEVIKGKIYIINTSNASEKNVCTTAQVDIATAKNWQVLDNKNWVNYPGS